jgi:autotransporter translocation and assembly factor TamB
MALEVELDMMVTLVTLVAVLVMVLGTQVEALTQVQTLAAAAAEVLAGLVVLAVTVAGTVELEELVYQTIIGQVTTRLMLKVDMVATVWVPLARLILGMVVMVGMVVLFLTQYQMGAVG